jgi:hypothetical protein
MSSWKFHVRCKQCMTVLATLTMTEGVLTAGLVEVVPERRSDDIFTHEAAIPAQPLAPITTRIKLATSDFTPCNYVVRCECATLRIHAPVHCRVLFLKVGDSTPSIRLLPSQRLQSHRAGADPRSDTSRVSACSDAKLIAVGKTA